MSTHINANKSDIAKIVLMPGDPLRAKFIAETYLKDYKLVNNVRGMLAYSGYYNNHYISVMGSGMGMPSIGIYSYELYKEYDVDVIIRVGSAGSYHKDINLYDVIIVDDAYSESSYAKICNNYSSNLISSDSSLTSHIVNTAKDNNIDIIQGTVHSSDVFYNLNFDITHYQKKNCLCVEMESFALFFNAKILNKKASCILTISDSLISKELTTSLQREKSFTKMIELALNSAISYNLDI